MKCDDPAPLLTSVRLQQRAIGQENLAVGPIGGVLCPQVGMKWPRSTKLASVGLALTAGLVLALLTLALGPIALPIVYFVLFLPWLMKDTFRLFAWLIVTWPFLTLYVRIPLPAGFPDISYERLMVLFSFSIIFLDGFVAKRRQLKSGWLTVLAGVFFAAQLGTRLHVILFQGIGAPDLDGLLSAVLIPIVMYWITKNVLVSRRHLSWLLYTLVLASLMICFSGLIDQVIGSDKSVFRAPIEFGGSAESYARYMDVPGGRAAGVMGNPGIYGAVLGIGILASISYFHHASEKRAQIFLLASTLILLFGVFASYTRQAWISVAITLFLAQFFISDLWKRFLPLFGIITLLLMMMWGYLAESSLMESRVLNPYNVNVRVELARLAWELFLEKPLFGWGSEALNIMGLEGVGVSSHNAFLSLLVDGGLVLFLAFLTVLVYLLFRITQVYRKSERSSLERSVLITTSGFILIFLMSGMARELRYFGYFNAMFWICAGVIDRLADGYASKGEVSECNPHIGTVFQEIVSCDG